MLFYSHALSLPAFVFAIADLKEHALLWCESPSTATALSGLFGYQESTIVLAMGPLAHMPSTWFYVLVNMLTQYVCVRGVFMVGQAAGALTLTLALTIRKFLSLFLSIWFFGNTFSKYHWLGAAFVFVGLMIYSLTKAKPKTD